MKSCQAIRLSGVWVGPLAQKISHHTHIIDLSSICYWSFIGSTTEKYEKH
jgi:hypothetical protein